MTSNGANPVKQMDTEKGREFTIDEEFEALMPPLTSEKYEDLRKNIQNNIQKGVACCDPLTVWKEEKILIDGHHRNKICRELGVIPPVQEISFESREEVVKYMEGLQRGRRNMNRFRWAECALRRKEFYAAKAKMNQSEAGKEGFLKSGKVHTDKILAEEAGVSPDTIYKVSAIQKKASAEKIDTLRRGDLEVSINSVFEEVQGIKKEKAASKSPLVRQKKPSSSPPPDVPKVDDPFLSNPLQFIYDRLVAIEKEDREKPPQELTTPPDTALAPLGDNDSPFVLEEGEMPPKVVREKIKEVLDTVIALDESLSVKKHRVVFHTIMTKGYSAEHPLSMTSRLWLSGQTVVRIGLFFNHHKVADDFRLSTSRQPEQTAGEIAKVAILYLLCTICRFALPK